MRARPFFIGAVSAHHGLYAGDGRVIHYRGYGRRLRRGPVEEVTLAELSPNGAPRAGLRGGLSGSVGRLHAKVAMVDERWLMIGSLNMDARSSRANTELALVIDSEELSREMSALLRRQWHDDHYRPRIVEVPVVARGEMGPAPRRIEWVGTSRSGPSRVHASEPQVPWLSRLRGGLMSVFVPEDLL